MTVIEHCPRAKSEMTPCVRRDKYAADDDRCCVGCGFGADEVADELRDIAQGAVDQLAGAVANERQRIIERLLHASNLIDSGEISRTVVTLEKMAMLLTIEGGQ